MLLYFPPKVYLLRSKVWQIWVSECFCLFFDSQRSHEELSFFLDDSTVRKKKATTEFLDLLNI